MSQEIKIDERGTDKQGRGVSTMEKDLNTMKSALTVSQRAAIGFAAGVIGAAAVVLFSHALFRLGLSLHISQIFVESGNFVQKSTGRLF